VCPQSSEDFGVNALGDTNDVLGGIVHLGIFLEFLELLGGLFALRTFLGRGVTIILQFVCFVISY